MLKFTCEQIELIHIIAKDLYETSEKLNDIDAAKMLKDEAGALLTSAINRKL